MQVLPARAMGPFRIGTPLFAVIQQIQKINPDLSVGAVVSESRGVVSQLVIDAFGLVLTFHPRTFLLESIRATNLSLLELYHQEGSLCGRGATPTFVRLYELLGPTFAGVMNDTTGEYVLSYPGLDVVFRIPVDHRSLFKDGTHPITLPDGTTPVALEIHVREEKAGSLTIPPTYFVAPWSTAVLSWGRGIDLVSWPDGDKRQSITFGMCVQDVLALLGPPDSWMQKDDSRLRIHGADSADRTRSDALLFSLNYPSHGLDLLFSSVDGLLEKICLFTGAQHHDAFLQYHRSWFEMDVDLDHVHAWLGGSVPVVSSTPKRLRVGPSTPWRAVADLVKSTGPVPRPLLAAAPSGTLTVCALSGIIFTVVQETDEIAMITLVKPASQGLPRVELPDTPPVALTPTATFAAPQEEPIHAPPLQLQAAVPAPTGSGEFEDVWFTEEVPAKELPNKGGADVLAPAPIPVQPAATIAPIAHPIDKFFTLGSALLADQSDHDDEDPALSNRNKPTVAEFESSDSSGPMAVDHADISLTVSPMVAATTMPPPPPNVLEKTSEKPDECETPGAEHQSYETSPALKGGLSPDADDDATPPITPGGGVKVVGASIALKPSKKKSNKGKGKR